MSGAYSYSIFFDFIESYLPSGFLKIGTEDPIIQQLNLLMDENDQFITVADLAKIKFLYVSEGIRRMIGVEPSQLNPSHFVEVTHPDDLSRFGLLRAQTFVVEKEVLETKMGSALVSFTIRLRNPEESISIVSVRPIFSFLQSLTMQSIYYRSSVMLTDSKRKNMVFIIIKGKTYLTSDILIMSC